MHYANADAFIALSKCDIWAFVKNADSQSHLVATECESAMSTSFSTVSQGWPRIRITQGGLENPGSWIYSRDSDLIGLGCGLGSRTLLRYN